MLEFSQRVIAVIRQIPRGKVMTYGQIAAVAGEPGSARQVSRILHSCSEKYNLPWQRVINSRLRLSLTGGHQEAMLRAEGVEFDLKGQVLMGCLVSKLS